MELTYPETKRIKLEHSYAFDFESNQVEDTKIKEEDPLEILEDTSIIKLETEEDVVIKNEVPEDVKNDANGNFEYFNLPSVSAELENYSDSTSGSLVVGESGICTNESNSLDTNNVTSIVDPLTLVDNCDEMVPKHILLELQKQYLNTIETLKQRNTLLVIDADKLAKENRKLSNTMFEKIPSTILPSPRDKVLAAKVKELKKELYIVKANEKSLAAQLQLREQDVEIVKKANVLLGKQFANDVKLKDEYIKEIKDKVRKDNSPKWKDLQDQLATKETLVKSLETKCSALTQKVVDLTNENTSTKSDLTKAKSDLLDMKKALFDSINIRQILTERSIRLNKELYEAKNNLAHKIQLQETRAEMLKFAKRVALLRKTLADEMKKSSYLVKEREQLMQEQERRYQEVRKELQQARQSLSACRTLLSRKMESCLMLRKEVEKLTLDLNLFKEREEEIKTKVCEYCGF